MLLIMENTEANIKLMLKAIPTKEYQSSKILRGIKDYFRKNGVLSEKQFAVVKVYYNAEQK